MLSKILLALSIPVLSSSLSALQDSSSAPLTRDTGAPVGDNQNSKTAGPRGGVLLEDTHLIEKLARFDRERTPERVVHARGTGAHGVFENYADLSDYTMAAPFDVAGELTQIFVRFSTVVHSKGSPETLRDPRGFAIKFYTEEGNWDLVGNNLPVFFIRDAMKFPDMVHSLKPSPITNKQDPNRFFDFFSHVPESTHMLTFLYQDLGIPASYRKMNGFGVHAYKWINAEGRVRYVKYAWHSEQGIETLTPEQAAEVVGRDFNNLTTDLYGALARGESPSWELRVQLLDPDDLDMFDYDPLDATKLWLGVPEMPIGRFRLNRVPDNFFQETEQAAFSPANLIPGMEPSEDRLLQGRLFSYLDTQRHRIGGNFQSLPINSPHGQVSSHKQDGAMNHGHTTSDVNYEPSIHAGTPSASAHARASRSPLSGSTQQLVTSKPLNFAQAGFLYESLSEEERAHLIHNFAGDLLQVRNPIVKRRIVHHAYEAHAEYGARLSEAVSLNLEEVLEESIVAPD